MIRDYLTIVAKDDDGDPVPFGFWTGADDVTVTVPNLDGNTESRNFVGGGTLLEVPPVVDAVGLEIRTVTFGLSQIHANVALMVRGHTIRVARVELHRGELGADNGELVDDPELLFAGRVDAAKIEDAAIGGEGRTDIMAVGDVVDLTRTSPMLKSDESQKLRSGDRFRRYADTAAAVDVFWGQARGKAE